MARLVFGSTVKTARAIETYKRRKPLNGEALNEVKRRRH